ncbi:MAG: cytochrome c oxidase subunit 3 [Phycisphaeraceae bacterium]|nr:cytochrome c oxidase subunit 3 [Phycisphaeraceae bacterium]
MTSIHAHGAHGAIVDEHPDHPIDGNTPRVASHFRNYEEQFDAGKLGMWLFLTTEILLFSGFFVAYAVFRMLYPEAFKGASEYYLNWKIGFVNTCVLLLSSYTIAASIRNAQKNQQGMLKINLLITILCAVFFLVVKLGWEYWPKYQKGEFGGGLFTYSGGTWDQEPLFLSIYWVATATHGIHVLVGIFIISWLLWGASKRRYGPWNYLAIENTGLYWHIVDLIWIFLFPLLYLA